MIVNSSKLNLSNSALLLNNMTKVEATHKLLSAAKIHNKVVGVIELEDGRRRQSIQNMIQVWDNDQWILFFSYGEGQFDYIIWAPDC